MKIKQIFVGFFSAMILATVTAASDENLTFEFAFSCPIDAENCTPQKIPETENEFLVANPELGKPLEIELRIRNPKNEMITSARAKLKFDPQKIDVLRVSTDDSDFPLFAPGEKDVDREKGTVLIGGSFTSGSKSDAEFLFAKLVVKPKVLGAKIDFLNVQKNELGDTGILLTRGIDTENKLLEKPKPLVFGKATGKNPPKIPPKNPPIEISEPVEIPEISKKQSCPRPENLRLQTDAAGKVRLLWADPTGNCVAGYFVYFSQKSGFYIRRRDVGKTNFVEITDLEKDKKYCFAITNYNAENTESDYSDEACVVVGQPGTETAGFLGDPRQKNQIPKNQNPPKKIPTGGKNVQSGPAGIFFLVIFAAGAAMTAFSFRRKS